MGQAGQIAPTSDRGPSQLDIEGRAKKLKEYFFLFRDKKKYSFNFDERFSKYSVDTYSESQLIILTHNHSIDQIR